METELIIRGRIINDASLELIKQVTGKHWGRGRTFISRELCKIWDWRQPNGKLKDQVCRILLCQLEKRELLRLPPRKGGTTKGKKRYYIAPNPPPPYPDTPLVEKLKDFPGITLKMVRRCPEEALWNYLVYRYHYKSYKIIVGAHLKYIAYADAIPVACLAWCSSIFRIQCRDEFIGWTPQAKNHNIRQVVNNSRFLILPWVRIKNLASHLLAKSARALKEDWRNFYGHPVSLLETFVETDRFRGTCYQAANWIKIGQTKGHAKSQGKFYYHGRRKAVYLYPLTPDYRELLCELPLEGGRPA